MLGWRRSDWLGGLIRTLVVSCLLFSCSDESKEALIELPVAQHNSWSVSGLRLHVSSLDDPGQFSVNNRKIEGISAVVKELSSKPEKHSRVSFTLPATFRARDYIEMVTQFRIESGREVGSAIFCRRLKGDEEIIGHFLPPLFIAAEDSHPRYVLDEHTPRLKIGMERFEWDGKIRRSLSAVYDKLKLTLEVASLTDSQPIVLLTVENDVDMQRLIETFDFDDASSLVMYVE